MSEISINNAVVVDLDWATFRPKVDGTEDALPVREFNQDLSGRTIAVLLASHGGGFFYRCDLDKSSADYTDWITNVKPLANTIRRQTGDTGELLVSSITPAGSETIYTTHNFADKTTWYSESVRVTDEAAVDSGDGLTWNLANGNLIDLTHGKSWNEERAVANEPNGHGYAVVVKVNGVVKTERPPFQSSGGDYVVDYANGKIIFDVSQAGNTVQVSYSYATTGRWRLAPLSGRILRIDSAKLLLSDDFVYNDTVVFRVVKDATTNPVDVVSPIYYKTLSQLLEEAVRVSASPVMGGVNRGTAVGHHLYEFDYRRTRDLRSSLDMQLWIELANDIPAGGAMAAVAFHCTSMRE